MTRVKSGRWTIHAAELPIRQKDEAVQQSLPPGFGTGHSTLIQLDPDLNCIETRYAPSRDLAILSRMEQQEPRMVLTLGLKGRSSFVDYKGGEIAFREGYATITAFNSSSGERHYRSAEPVVQLRFSLSRQWLDRYFGENRFASFFKRRDPQILSHRPISSRGAIAARQILSECSPAPAQKVFLHGQALSILASELNAICADDCRHSSKFGPKDLAMANAARDILWSEFRSPPSVAELSRRVGTNQFKLKQLFHHCFSNTPYGLLLEFRMSKAYELLESTRCPVGVAAEFVGYQHASSFSAAFVRHFGVSPKKVASKS